MSMTPLRKHVALAIDGGGIKGLIVARALMALEDELGGKPLIEQPQLRVLAGTSTGAMITAAIAMGMKAEEITQVYVNMGQEVFPPLTRLPKAAAHVDELAKMASKPFLYSNEKLIDLLKTIIKERTGNADITLAELNQRLGPDKILILTAVDITARRTRFLKSHEPASGTWKLWEAILASSSAPIALPVWTTVEPDGKSVYYTDGGVGSYGNPAFVAAQEALVFQGYPPEDVSVLSFGTGWVNAENFERASGKPTHWHGLNWAMNAPLLLLDDAARAQSLQILEELGDGRVDFRRFQFELVEDISSDGYGNDAAYALMNKLGDELGERVRHDQFAPNADPRFDPEGLYEAQQEYRASREAGRARRI
jgi:patatin-like phospholipase/acyl hydrolase